MTERPKQTNCQNEPAYPDHDTELFLFRYPDKFPLHQKIEEINNKDKLIISKPKNSGVCYVHPKKKLSPEAQAQSAENRTRETISKLLIECFH